MLQKPNNRCSVLLQWPKRERRQLPKPERIKTQKPPSSVFVENGGLYIVKKTENNVGRSWLLMLPKQLLSLISIINFGNKYFLIGERKIMRSLFC